MFLSGEPKNPIYLVSGWEVNYPMRTCVTSDGLSMLVTCCHRSTTRENTSYRGLIPEKANPDQQVQQIQGVSL